MIAAAIVMMVGGVQLSRKTDTRVSPYDRERLLDFTHSFQRELNRIETLYLSHLADLSKLHLPSERTALLSEAKWIAGIEAIYVFHSNKNLPSGKVSSSESTLGIHYNPRQKMAPELGLVTTIVSPKISDSQITLPASLFEGFFSADQAELITPSKYFKVYIIRLDSETLVAFVIDYPALHRLAYKSLGTWTSKNAAPLVEAHESVTVRSSHIKEPLLSSGVGRVGPSAVIIPYRSLLGDFEIRAWDGIMTRSTYDPAILTISATLASILSFIGIILFIHHRRATQLAIQRVSFVNQVSHELSTPMTNLNLNVDLACHFLLVKPPEAMKRLQLVKEELARLSRLVSNILTFSNTERKVLIIKSEACHPAEIICSALDTFRPSLERHGFRVITNLVTTPPVLLSSDGLAQILTNLLSNAEKYASLGKRLEISMKFENETLIVTFSDDGPGIPPSQRSQIFKPFKRLSDKSTEGVSGMGLGLAIAQSLATQMGGSLKVLPTDRGATFELTIPAPIAK